MELRGDERGQAIQVGAVLLLAVFVITLSLYQATVIPNENKQVEFNDYRDATADFANLRNAILRSAAQDAQSGVTVRTGSQYPARSLFVNPPPAAGRLSSSPAANVTISNVESAGDYENVRKYLDAEGNAFNVSTRHLVFAPSYNELDVAPVATAYGATYRNYDEPIFTTEQTLVEGNRITLVSIAGNLSAGGYATPVTVEPVSAHTRTVSVTGDGGPLNLTVSTPLSASVWEDRLLAGQMAPDGHVLDVTPGPRPGTVNVSLAGDQTYELRLGRVEIRERSDSASEPTPAPRYVVSPTERRVTADDDHRAKLVVETRDRFNNPASNANVTFDAPIGHFETRDGTNLTATTTVRTDANGRAIVWFNGTDNYGNHDVEAYLGDTVDTSLPAEKRLTFVVTNPPGGGVGGEGFVVREAVVPTEPGNQGKTYRSMNFTLNNTGSSPINITGVGLSYITLEGSSGELSDGPNTITEVTLYSAPGSENRTVDAGESGGPTFFIGDPLELATGVTDVKFTFEQNYPLSNNEAVMVTLQVYFEGGISASYSVFLFG